MGRSNNLEMINTKYILSPNQQTYYRDQLALLLNKVGIISICLESKWLFIEYNEEILNKDLIRKLLLEINFPIKELSSKSKNEIIFSQNNLIN